jgi:glycosyltransferase involved in cell wall biosynthesis
VLKPVVKVMNVLHLATTYPLHGDDSNAAFVEALVEGLCRRGHQVHVLLPWHPQLKLQRERGSAVLHAFNTTPLRSWHPWGYAQALGADRSLRWDAYLATPFAAVAAVRALRRIMNETPIDLVHANWLLPAAPIVASALRGRHQPMVVSCHGSGVFLAENRAWAAAAARWGLERAAALTACSRDLAHRVGVLDAGPKPEWIPYGVDIARFRPAAADVRAERRASFGRRLGVSPDAPWVLAVGRLVYKKGFEYLVRAMASVRARVPDAQLLIAGDGPLGGDLARAAADSGVSDALHLIGPVSHAALPDLYGAVDIVAVPSVHGPSDNVDGLPNVFLEGLASGNAVVASRVGGIPDIGRDGETVALVPEADVEALAAALAGLLQDDARRAALGKAARADAEARLDWDQVAGRFENLYESVLRR